MTINRQVIDVWIQRSNKLYGAEIETNAFKCLDLAKLPSLFSGFQVMDFLLRHRTKAELYSWITDEIIVAVALFDASKFDFSFLKSFSIDCNLLLEPSSLWNFQDKNVTSPAIYV